MACVKADGYGHGIVTVAEALRSHARGYAVACIEEALRLRDASMELPILLLEGPHARAEIDEAFARGLILCISDQRQLDWLASSAPGRRPPCWLKVDSGMHRLGFLPDDARGALARLRDLTDVESLVLCTHFAAADTPGDPTTAEQLRRFDAVAAGTPFAQSCANSAAVIDHPASHRDWIRPGYMLYGGSPFADRRTSDLGLAPAMEFSAEIIALRQVGVGEGVGYGGRWRARRPSTIATVAAGYADGYPRHAVDGTPVRIGAHRSPLAGRVSMDMITVDVTDNPDARVGARAILWGDDPGVDEIARASNTIGYELLSAMPSRVPREVVA